MDRPIAVCPWPWDCDRHHRTLKGFGPAETLKGLWEVQRPFRGAVDASKMDPKRNTINN